LGFKIQKIRRFPLGLKTTKGLCDTINPDLEDSYFLANIDGKKKYLHKNTAIWYLMDEKHKLSSDRLNRVMQNQQTRFF
jgi:hypothetical protein